MNWSQVLFFSGTRLLWFCELAAGAFLFHGIVAAGPLILFFCRTILSEVRLCFMFLGQPKVKKEPIVIDSAKAKSQV